MSSQAPHSIAGRGARGAGRGARGAGDGVNAGAVGDGGLPRSLGDVRRDRPGATTLLAQLALATRKLPKHPATRVRTSSEHGYTSSFS
jgi:hypothetical protein